MPAAQRGADVPHRREVSHLLDRDLHDGLAPARDRLGLFGAQAFGNTRAQTESRVQVGAHQVVL